MASEKMSQIFNLSKTGTGSNCIKNQANQHPNCFIPTEYQAHPLF
jgi:hypothetical protein